MQCRVQFIINLFNVSNVLLGVIYQLNFTVFMYVTGISRHSRIKSSVLSAILHNLGRSWKVLPVHTGQTVYQSN
jgi:hypothetical protein